MSTAAAATAAPAALPARAQAVLAYWFGDGYASKAEAWAAPEIEKKWFQGGPVVDKEIVELFTQDVDNIGLGLYDPWIEQPLSAVAGIILMDQFTRNAYRGTPKMFSLDPKARTWALHMWDTERAWALPPAMQLFLMLPLEHSEDLADQERGVAILHDMERRWVASNPGEEAVLKKLKFVTQFAVDHRDIIAKWGRFPHRNALLGRASTPEEEAGLASGEIKRF